MEINKIHHGDALTVLKTMPDESVNCCVTSPPYWCLRDYGIEGQLGIEKIPEEYVSKMVEIFREVRRGIRDDGTLWLNLGDYYNNDEIREQHAEPERGKGEPEKNNWSVDCKRGSHETVRLYNPAGRNKRTVWTVATQPFKDAHFATFPLELIRPCILAGCPEGGIVLDPFMGAGTTAQVCLENDRNFRGIELNSKYIEIAEKRIKHLREQGKLFNGGHINVS